ncbi:MAG: hypothetical protein R2815_10390 [Flavobacteriales bacterium]|nr:hypothetical protein [Flavobacteriales bacterium]
MKRGILVPWLLSGALMFGLSYLWHGIALRDFAELKVPLALYLALAAIVYLVIGLGITLITHKAIEYEWISLKRAFPLMTMLLSAAVGFFVYLVIFVLGMSFAKHDVVHVAVDVIWQMFEQSLGGLAVSLGIIYDMRERFLEQERAS